MTDGIRDALGMDSKNRENRGDEEMQDGDKISYGEEFRDLNEQLRQERERAEQAERDNRDLKKIIRAQNKIILHYKVGKPTMPEWVFDTLSKAREKFGDLDKLK